MEASAMDVVSATKTSEATGNDVAATTTNSSSATGPEVGGEKVKFTLTFKKQKFEVEWPLEDTIANLRAHFHQLTGVPVPLQKIMFKGPLTGNTLREAGLKNGAKVMLIGSTLNEVVQVNITPEQTSVAEAEEAKTKEPLSEQTKHKKILEKGLPENAMPGIKGRNEPLPEAPLVGILNNRGTPVRLTFKVWSQELWISSKTSTQQLPFASIKAIHSEPIKGKEEYHIMTLQLGQSENSKYCLYYVPNQYVKAIKDAILGGFI
ncbi:Ubiquitin domain-containing protein ubfd1 [Balamuthia mandrillaris]